MDSFFNPCLPHMHYKTLLSPTFCLLLHQLINVDIRIEETSVSEIWIRKYSICLPALPVLADWFSLPVHPAWNELIIIRLLYGWIIWGDNEALVWLGCDREGSSQSDSEGCRLLGAWWGTSVSADPRLEITLSPSGPHLLTIRTAENCVHGHIGELNLN